MLIGLISDTHVARPEDELPSQIYTVFDGVELILHAGDIWVPRVLDELETIAPVIATWGDDDMESDLGGDARMMNDRDISLDGMKLWLMHQKPAYGVMVPRKYRIGARQQEENSHETPDVVIYGHNHHALIENHKGVLVINPGSATWPDYMPEPGTVGLLTIESGKVEAQIVSLK